MLLQLQKLSEQRREWQGSNPKDDDLVLLTPIASPHFAVNALAQILGGTIRNDIILDLLLEVATDLRFHKIK